MSIHSELLYSIDSTQIFLDISNQSRNFSLIKTARANQDQRALIRVHYKLDYRKVKTVPFPAVRFLLGRGGPNEDSQISAAIQKEIEEFGDIIVGSFEDTYDNLPLKELKIIQQLRRISVIFVQINISIYFCPLELEKMEATVKVRTRDL